MPTYENLDLKVTQPRQLDGSDVVLSLKLRLFSAEPINFAIHMSKTMHLAIKLLYRVTDPNGPFGGRIV